MTGPAVGQVKRFFRFYSINRHKMTTLTPSCGPAPCRAGRAAVEPGGTDRAAATQRTGATAT